MRRPRRPTIFLALAVLGGCSHPRGPPRASGPSLDSLLFAGESLYFRAAHDSARALWQRGLEEAGARGDSAHVAKFLTWQGNQAWKLGDFATARRLGEQALALKLRLGLRHDLFRSYNALGLVAWDEGRLSDANTLFTEAMEAARAVDSARGVAGAAGNMALVQTELGEFDAARQGFLAAREGARVVKDPRVEANALTNLGMLEIRDGNPSAAILILLEARSLYRAAGIVAQEQNALGQLGTAYDALGEPRLAIAALDSALRLVREHGLRPEEASNLEALARVYREAGDTRRTLELYAAAEAINKDVGLEVEYGTDLRAEAETHASLGDLGLAERYGSRALAIHRRTRAHFEELGDLLVLADVADGMGDRGQSAVHLAAARRLAGSLGARSARVDVALAAARIVDRRSDSRGTLRALDGADADLAQGGYRAEWEGSALRSRAYARLGLLAQAAAAGRKAVAAVERVRGAFGSAQLRTAYVADKAAAYGDLVGVLVRLGRVEEAFEVSDAARGRALLEHLASDREASAADPTARAILGGEQLLGRIGALVSEIDDHERAAAGEPDSAERQTIRGLYEKLAKARGDYEAALVRAAEERGPGAALLGAAPAGAAAVAAAVAPGEALLEYLVAPDRVFCFVVTRPGVRVVEGRVSAEQLVGRVRLARDLLGKPAGSGAVVEPVLGALHDILIGPVQRAGLLRGVRRIVVIPQGVLTYLPFAALRDENTGRYLVEDYALVTLPSAAALAALRRAAPGGRPAAGQVVVFAPFPERLPATRAEATALGATLSRVKVRLGRQATESRLRDALARGGLVHVASHGLLNARNPLFSRIELFRGSASEAQDDGRLEVHEVLGLSVAAPLVFLSGCETGLGAAWSTGFARGEDFATLAQAFLYAGAGNVIATLWRVEDEGAAAFATTFYRQLRESPPLEALARAQQAMLAQPRHRAPYYWAAYVLTGDGAVSARAQKPTAMSVQQ